MFASPAFSVADATLRRLPRAVLVGAGVASICGLAVLGAAGHHGLPLETFYVAPVLLVAWLTGSTACGLVVAAAAVLARPVETLAYGAASAGPAPHPALLALGVLLQLLVYLALLLLLAWVRESLHQRRTEALRDELTGIANRRAFLASAEVELERSRRYRHQLSLLYLDVDDFKAVNDRLGHGEGNRLLRRLTVVLTAELRSVDLAARLGGDEFAVLMPETGSRAARQLAVRLLAALSAEHASDGAPLSCSCGLVTFRLPPGSVDALLEAGDRLMYEAKAAGKGRLQSVVLPAVRTAGASTVTTDAHR